MAIGLPDFDQFHDGLALGTGKGVAAETDFEAVTPVGRGESFDEGRKVKERKLQAQLFQRCSYFLQSFRFGVTSVEVSMAHYLHSLRGNMFDHERDEIQG